MFHGPPNDILYQNSVPLKLCCLWGVCYIGVPGETRKMDKRVLDRVPLNYAPPHSTI